MKFGICGLGRMGAALALQAMKRGHEVIGFDPKGSAQLEQAGATVVGSIGALVDALAPPRVALVYVPHGYATEQVIAERADRFEDGDVVVGGGNTPAVWGFYESRDLDRPWAKTVALLRHEYGQHPLQGSAGTTS